jgi:hypothetical protein
VVDNVEPEIWVVAGCLFEVSLPDGGALPWQWRNPGPEVTLLGEAVGGDARHFRFRAEASGAEAGTVQLRFGNTNDHGAVVVRAVVVRVVPEADLG